MSNFSDIIPVLGIQNWTKMTVFQFEGKYSYYAQNKVNGSNFGTGRLLFFHTCYGKLLSHCFYLGNRSFFLHSAKNYGAMAKWLRHWTPNPGVSYSKPLGGTKVDSALHPSEVNKMNTRNFWERSGKK